MSLEFYYFTDPHVMGTSPRSRTDVYLDTICAKLEEIVERANQRDAYLLCGGDLCDRHDTAPSVVGRIARIFDKLKKGPVFMVIGNHDIYGHNPSIANKTMLGILEAAGTVKFLSQADPVFFGDDGIRVQLTGTHYHVHIDKTADDYFVKKLPDVHVAIHIVHGYLVDRPWPKHDKYTLIPDVKTEADYILTGHEHYGFGIYSRPDGVTFCNPGALGRVKAAIQEMTRIPKVAHIRVYEENSIIRSDLTLETLDSVKLGNQVLDRKRLEEEIDKKKKVQQFVATLEQSNDLQRVDLSSILDTLAGLNNVPAEVLEEARRRIETIQARMAYRE